MIRFQALLNEEEAKWVDQYAEKAQMNRSSVIRLAVKRLRASVGGSDGSKNSSSILTASRKPKKPTRDANSLPAPTRTEMAQRASQSAKILAWQGNQSPSLPSTSPPSASSTSEFGDSPSTSPKPSKELAGKPTSSSKTPTSVRTVNSGYQKSPEECAHPGVFRTRDGLCRVCGEIRR